SEFTESVYLFRVGKAYTTFYKTGLKAILTNRRLSRNLPAANPTRADVLLYRRVRHDLQRLPLFAVILLVCGELTPFIILLFPSLSPYTCRIPAQVAAIKRSLQARRDASFRSLSYVDKADGAALTNVTDGHICRSLGLGSPLWDKIGFDVPWARRRGLGMAQWIAADDAMLRNGGGVRALVDDEVVLACDARGIDTLEKDVTSLRSRLEAWVAGSAPSEAKKDDFEAAVKESTGEFAIPVDFALSNWTMTTNMSAISSSTTSSPSVLACNLAAEDSHRCKCPPPSTDFNPDLNHDA
ncbi:hypothetical protein CIB48_g2998, partial [Xylaria polymorpha]